MKPEDLAKLFENVEEAQKEFEHASENARQSRHSQTRALNNLNNAQKACDKALDEMTKKANPESDWARSVRGTSK